MDAAKFDLSKRGAGGATWVDRMGGRYPRCGRPLVRHSLPVRLQSPCAHPGGTVHDYVGHRIFEMNLNIEGQIRRYALGSPGCDPCLSLSNSARSLRGTERFIYLTIAFWSPRQCAASSVSHFPLDDVTVKSRLEPSMP